MLNFVCMLCDCHLKAHALLIALIKADLPDGNSRFMSLIGREII